MENLETKLAAELWENEQKRKALEAQAKDLKKIYNEKAEELVEYLTEEGKSSTGHIEGVGEFRLAPKCFLSVTKANLPQFIEHVKEQGDGELVKETIEASTLKAYLGEKHEQLCARLSEDLAYAEEVANELGLTLADCTLSEVAAKQLERLGVSEFTEIKLSHTKKGK